ncbi:MAG: DGQHR domain-containing protein [Candidatus Promineifilaceae bacterium]
MNELKITAIRMQQKQNDLYLFSISADQLRKLVVSDRKLSTNPSGIQRLLNKKRIQDIGKYISSPKTCFPNNIIVSLSTEVRFELQNAKNNWGVLVFPSQEGHFGDLIDGQHRLYGITGENSTVSDLPVPVTGLMQGKKLAGRIFADINRLQKPVSKVLLVALQRELGDLVDAKDNAAAIVEQLNDDVASPMHGKIKMYQDEKRKWITNDQAINTLSPLFEKGELLSFLSTDVAFSRIKSYLEAIRETFSDAWGNNRTHRLTKAAGFETIMGIFERTHQRARDVTAGSSPKKESFIQALEPINDTDWTAEHFKENGFTASAGRKILLRQLLGQLPPAS